MASPTTFGETIRMIQLLAHITEQEIPSFWLAALLGFVAGAAVTFATMVRKLK